MTPRILSTFSSCAFGNVGLPTPAPNFCQQNDARLESMQKQFHAVSMTGIVTFPRGLSFLTGTGRSHTFEKCWTASTHNGIAPMAESPVNATLLGTRNVVAVRCTRPGSSFSDDGRFGACQGVNAALGGGGVSSENIVTESLPARQHEMRRVKGFTIIKKCLGHSKSRGECSVRYFQCLRRVEAA